MLVALCSDKGSPGTTTTALALASCWPSPAVVLEADPDGGDLGIRMRIGAGGVLPETPTVLTVATAARSAAPGEAEMVERYAQRVNDQLSVVPGHLVAEQAAGVTDWQPLADSLAASRIPVFLDAGRLHASSPLVAVAAAADVLVVVGRAETESLIRLRERVARLVPVLAARRDTPPRLCPVLVARERHGPAEVADMRRLLEESAAGPLLVGAGFVAFDPAGVDRLVAGESAMGRLGRSALLRSARSMVTQLPALVGAGERAEAR